VTVAARTCGHSPRSNSGSRASRRIWWSTSAGADSHESDPKNRSGFSARALAERDLAVFRMARRAGVPLVFVVAGGYQRAADIARINLTTARCALRVFTPRRLR